jgi:hypothetical protein
LEPWSEKSREPRAAVSKFRCFHDGARSLFLSAVVSVDPERRYWPSGFTALFRLWRTRFPPRDRHLFPIALWKADCMLRENEPEIPEIKTDKVCLVAAKSRALLAEDVGAQSDSSNDFAREQGASIDPSPVRPLDPLVLALCVDMANVLLFRRFPIA